MTLGQIVFTIKESSHKIKAEREKDIVDEFKVKKATAHLVGGIAELSKLAADEAAHLALIQALDSETLQILIDQFRMEGDGYTDSKGNITLLFFHLSANEINSAEISQKFGHDWSNLSLTLLNDSHPWVIENTVSAISFITKNADYLLKMLSVFLAHNGIAQLLSLRENNKESVNISLKYCLLIILANLLSKVENYSEIILEEREKNLFNQFIIDAPKELINALKNDPDVFIKCRVSLLLTLLANNKSNHSAIIKAFTKEEGRSLVELREYAPELDATVKRNILFMIGALVQNPENHSALANDPQENWERLLVQFGDDPTIADQRSKINEMIITLSNPSWAEALDARVDQVDDTSDKEEERTHSPAQLLSASFSNAGITTHEPIESSDLSQYDSTSDVYNWISGTEYKG